MEFVNYIISIALVAMLIQFGEPWMAIGASLIAMIASKETKASILIMISLIALFFIDTIGMKEYWLFAVIGLVAFGYLIGIGGNDQQQADPYAGLMSGMMG